MENLFSLPIAARKILGGTRVGIDGKMISMDLERTFA
jgi:hypothetical protein